MVKFEVLIPIIKILCFIVVLETAKHQLAYLRLRFFLKLAQEFSWSRPLETRFTCFSFLVFPSFLSENALIQPCRDSLP